MNKHFAQVLPHFSTLAKFGSNLRMPVMRLNDR
jgi:hypothetical protein